MLYTETVEPSTFSLLKELMEVKELQHFNLVGGTALSLRLGHRISVDLDLFTHDVFDNEIVVNELKINFGNRLQLNSTLNNRLGIFCFIDDIKIDICRHNGILIDEIFKEQDIRMWGFKDIAASKVNAISRRASKKDFWDINALLDIFSIEEIASFYRQKYDPMLAIGVAKIITYFDDAEDSETPNCLKKLTWLQVKKEIFKKINNNSK
ncbi:MAG: nucleotidyl transferase AbiEii/AbiGii toxin family protein [Ferruginibacter sp.]